MEPASPEWFGDTAVLFSVDTGSTFTSVTYEVPVAVSRQGDGPTADEGGVIRLEERPARRRPVRPR